jgi:FtsH-binding integral membrane protein
MKKIILWLGIGLILIAGVVHLIDAQDSFKEAAYKGCLFYANFLATLVVAFGIYRNKYWGWKFGFVIAVLSISFYCLSRSVGLPLIPAEPDAWFEPLGVISLLAEGLFVFLYIIKSRLNDA